MLNDFKAVSLSHQRAPLEVRTQFHLDGPAAESFATHLAEVLGMEELLVVSTCNRTEVYYHHPEDLSEKIIRMLCREKGTTATPEVQGYFEIINDNESAVRHLFEVSIGLHSQVVGDLQIAGQIKQAYATSAGLKLAGPFLHRLMHTIFHANKRVQQETGFRDGAASISYVAAELAASVAEGFGAPRALVVGAGEMGRDAALNLDKSLFTGGIAIANRTEEKARGLAADIGGKSLPLSEVTRQIHEHDVVLVGIETQEPLITTADFTGRKDGFKPLFIIDMSLPRAVQPEVGKLPGVVLFDLDDLRTRSDEALQKRLSAVSAVNAIVDQEMQAFLLWTRELSISPVIQQLRDALEQIRKDEMAKYLRNATGPEAELVEKVTRGMVEKIVKLPVLQLKAACKRGEESALIGVLQDLFDLEKQKNHA